MHVEVYGHRDSPAVLAIHGVTGHGARWAPLAENQLRDYRVIAPDLLGHGFSPASPPWSIEAQTEALAGVVAAHTASAPIVVGHSFGGALAIHLSRRVPVAALLLLDPAIGLHPDVALDFAVGMMRGGEYPDRAAAGAAKRAEAWWEVPEARLETELDAHLVDTGHGTVTFRYQRAAAVTAFSELARPATLPPADIPVCVVRAGKVSPPFASDEFLQRLRDSSGPRFSLYELDGDHMVAEAHPELVGELVAKVAAAVSAG